MMKMEPTLSLLIVISCFIYCSFAASSPAAEQQLYTDLFSNYSRDIRPVTLSNYNNTLSVSVMFGLTQIEALIEKDQQIKAHGFASLSWVDELLVWKSADYNYIDHIVVPASKIWLPELTPINSVVPALEIAADMGDDSRVKISSDGTVFWAPGLSWNTACDIEMADFPYDTQNCELHYANWMYVAPFLNFTTEPTIEQSAYFPNKEWELVGATAWTETVQTFNGPVLLTKVKLSMKRDPTFFEIYIVAPAFFLALLMIPIFMLPAESGEKISMGVTIMLAFSITLLILTDVTPRTSSVPKLSLLIMMAMAIGGLSIILSVIIVNIHHHNPEKPVPKWLKSLFLIKLAKVLCCMKYVDTDAVEPMREATVEISIGREKGSLGKEFAASNASTDEVLKYLQFFKSTRIADDIVAGNKDDWCNVARVMDRLFICIYTVLLVIGFIVFLVIKHT